MKGDRARAHRNEARTLATVAVARGWLTAADLWDLAWAARGGDVAVETELQRLLGPEPFAALRAELYESHDAPTRVSVDHSTISLTTTTTANPTDLTQPAGDFEGPRYASVHPIGSGGEGRIVACLDRELGRRVAVKIPLSTSQERLKQFLGEARLTARLEHPNIVPVYDLGLLGDGGPFYAMREVEPRSLRDVLRGDAWPLVRLLTAFTQVARALSYAHARGVLHGDVKPANILLGQFGQVYLADWGLARVRAERPFDPDGPPLELPTRDVGTLGYMAPEIYGEDTVDARADLFALGVVLYQIITRQRPFSGVDDAAVIVATCLEEPTSPRRLNPSCPLALEELCMSLLAKRPSGRPATAGEVADAVEAFLDGDREASLRRAMAADLCAQAAEPIERHQALARVSVQAEKKAREASREVKGWEPLEAKRPIWDEQDRAASARSTSAEALAAQKNRSQADRIYFETLTRDHDISGRYAAMMSARAKLVLRSNPGGAQTTAQRYREADRRLVLGEPIALGPTPIDAELEPGSYVITLAAPGFRDTRYPVLLRRGQRRAAEVNLFRNDEIGEAFVHVPAGEAIIGGDQSAFDPLPMQRVHVDDFAMAVLPVTVRDICAFLRDIDDDEAIKRGPHDRQGAEGLALHRTPSGDWEPDPHMIEGEARKLFPIEDGHLWRIPANLMDWFDARAYCRWRSERDGVAYRLPSDVEWEKAARGVDGRFFPWGDHFDPTFCKMRGSRRFTFQPEPVGTFEGDVSPYGVRDMAGGFREWVADIFDELSLRDAWNAPEPSPDVARFDTPARGVRGGSWNTPRDWCRAASRSRMFGTLRGTGLTFRLAKSLKRNS